MNQYAFVTYMVAVDDDNEIQTLPIPRGALACIDVIYNPDNDHTRIARNSFDKIGRTISRSLSSDVRRRGFPLHCHSSGRPVCQSYADGTGEQTHDAPEGLDEVRSSASGLPKWIPLGGIVHIEDHDVILPVERVLDDPKRGSMIGAALGNDLDAVQRYYRGFSELPRLEAIGRALEILRIAIIELERSRSPIN